MSGKQIALFVLFVFSSFTAIAQKEKEPAMDTLTIAEVAERAATLDQQTFRLKFYYRQGINQIDAESYWVRLFDLDYNHVVVTFPKEALNYFKKITAEEDSYKKFRNRDYYGTSSGSASSVYVTAKQVSQQTKPAWFTQYSFNSKLTPWLVLEGIGKSGSKNISGETKYKW
jgi:hypothetical protein